MTVSYQGLNTNQWLLKHAYNHTSLSGEDGILKKIFEILPGGDKWCVEFGAWDGKKYSNTYDLIAHNAWSGVLIEANETRFQDLLQTYGKNSNVVCLNRFVSFEGDTSLDSLLGATPIPRNFDLLSIDIDGNDYHIWDSVKKFIPKVVVIEFNPTIPSHVEFVQPRDMTVNQGTSLLSFVQLGKQKGYELICVTDYNAIFVERSLFPLFKIADNSLAALRPANKPDCPMFHVFQLYDGTFVLGGGDRMPWIGLPLRPDSLQVLPPSIRHYPANPRSIWQKVLWHSWYRLFYKR